MYHFQIRIAWVHHLQIIDLQWPPTTEVNVVMHNPYHMYYSFIAFSPMLLKREIIPMLLKRLPGVTSSSRLDMQCQENGQRTMSRSAQILRGLFGFKVKSLYKNSLGSSVDYQGYCFGVFGRYSINTVPGPQAELARLHPPSHSDDLETI